MAAKPVAYVPLTGNSSSPIINAPTNINKPEYSDVGVRYEGFSKTLIANNQYKLNPQVPFHLIFYFQNLVAAARADYFTETPPQGKTLYISSMEVNTSVAAFDTNSRIILHDYETDADLFRIQPVRSETYTINFTVPLKISSKLDNGAFPRGLEIYSNAGATTINNCTINLHGWIE